MVENISNTRCCGVKMRCPYCLSDETKVVDKRDVEGQVRRRRECLKCLRRFSTRETFERVELRVVKRDGRRETFEHEKIKKGVLIACQRRPISSEKIDKMLNKIEEKLRLKGKEVSSKVIGGLVSNELRKIDKIAYIRFASVYKDFSEVSDFNKEIRGLNK